MNSAVPETCQTMDYMNSFRQASDEYNGADFASCLQKSVEIMDSSDQAGAAPGIQDVHATRSRRIILNQGKCVVMELLAPKYFAFMRKNEALTNEQFSAAWKLPEEKCHLTFGAGRTLSLFLYSVKEELLLKTIPYEECQTLLRILPDYFEHIINCPNSFLMRYVMLMRMKFDGNHSDVYIIIARNVFRRARGLTEKWDLKGRYPKPLKYEQAIASLKEYLKQHPNDVPVRKDKHLQRAFFISSKHQEHVLNQLKTDFLFMDKHNLMDYSLLIGVVRRQQDEDDAKFEHPENDAEREKNSFSVGIPSFDNSEFFFIGIIDALTDFGVKKKVANFFKSFLWKDEALSTITPENYRKRLTNFCEFILPSTQNPMHP